MSRPLYYPDTHALTKEGSQARQDVSALLHGLFDYAKGQKLDLKELAELISIEAGIIATERASE